MSDPRGALKVKVDGDEYRLWMGMSVLAELQAKHGQDVLAHLDPPKDAADDWMPDMQIVVDLISGSLERYHPEKAQDRWFVDDLMAQNETVFMDVMAASGPEASTTPGKRKGRKPA